MLNLGRRDGPFDPKTAHKPALGTTGAATHAAAGTAARSSSPPPIPTLNTPVTPATPTKDSSAPAPDIAETAGSKLSVGPNIKLKGVEISNCDILIVEGHMEATVNSTAMKIAQPGTLKGIAVIDVAEIHGEFSGELTARKKLVVHGTGRVSGTIRYGTLIVTEGGDLTGDVKRLDASADPAQASSTRMSN
ncbi:MAG TPA: polymer-forming cytoskeletal protein [Casimicrobiaceae bacterium]|jgi:cytoskeletal protein CcmA (bactofilin family)|nr:polymer-forming cytoskeletal protein [Casimicrobiaceae bacterium]